MNKKQIVIKRNTEGKHSNLLLDHALNNYKGALYEYSEMIQKGNIRHHTHSTVHMKLLTVFEFNQVLTSTGKRPPRRKHFHTTLPAVCTFCCEYITLSNCWNKLMFSRKSMKSIFYWGYGLIKTTAAIRLVFSEEKKIFHLTIIYIT
jgi:hypothetical protein